MVEVIKLKDAPIKCPVCGALWEHDCFTLNSDDFKPKCGVCGYIWGDKKNDNVRR